tara:strand:+ start:47 stop:463 length:417 start_codon:yes stop_codon:yes gene_type:complete
VIVHKYRLKVYYKDVDQMGIVYYSRYFEYFEQARTELLSMIGLNVTTIEKSGVFIPVVVSHCEYKKGAKFEDELMVLTKIDEIPKSKLRINYTIKNLKLDKTYVEGYTIHAFLKNNDMAVRAPDSVLETIKKFWLTDQ